MKLKLLLTIFSATALISACDSSKDIDKQQPASDSAVVSELKNESTQEQQLANLYEDAAKALFIKRSLSATLYGLEESLAGGYYQNKMEDYSAANEAELRAILLDISNQIKNFPSEGLSREQVENKQVMTSLARYFAGHPDFSIGYIDVWMGLSPYVVNQINGPLIDIPRYIQNDHKITSEQDAIDYVERLAKFDQMIASVMQKFDADAAKGWIAPKVVLNGAVSYLQGFTQAEVQEHMLIKAFEEKLEKLQTISEDKKQSLLKQAAAKMEEIVYPAYQGMAEKVKNMADKAPDESGVWAQPDGEKYYQDAILQLGDSRLSADAIHQIGLDEVKRISMEMDSILIEQGYKEGSVGERMVKLNDEPRFLYPETDEGKKALLKDLNGYIEEITKKMAPVFKTKPPYEVEVRAFPVEIQDGAPGGQYTSPSVDGTKPGVYWINLRDMKANPKFSLKSLTYHEANPGHHWQVALNLAQADLPFLRRIAPYNAYIEGWALYSEQIAYELGLYQNDPFGNLGRLQAELFRAVRLVVDTGLHHKRWTREQAIEYMAKTTGSAESDVVAEIERYIAWPGQALGYKLGMLKILSLREAAKSALGDAFDLAEFHDLVLLGGAVPMTVLEAKVNRWIDNKKVALVKK
ncbi:DUF885 family protein [Aliikangiella sp. G2MR2-5]|uniref:DUF885 domain-containing protein n=1 Tax=Aliikangiella sp. G2MR2-5 TaxID=2788943 RepID=UPI0018AA0E61|nr:DUF885 domain-containing protein [Aliikangiella sp. G2MR2-5]